MAQNNADFGCTFAIRNANGTAYNLTGKSLEMQIKNKPGATAVATFLTTGASPNLVIQSPATAGLVTLGVPFGTMATLTPGLYYWDLLELDSSTSRTLLGSGTWRVTAGVTESPTASLPSASPLFGSGNSDIALTVGNSSLTLTLAPSGPPGTGAAFAPQIAPSPPAIGFALYCDQADGWLKAISSTGKITELAPPS